jgi:hypothetical protein
MGVIALRMGGLVVRWGLEVANLRFQSLLCGVSEA